MLASRLTEIPDFSVLLLEAGGNPPAESEIIGLYPTIERTVCDWQFVGNASNACKGLNNGCYMPRGKMLGGSSSLNWMYYVRGNQGDFDYWEKLGNPGWGSNSAWEYYKKSENNTYQPFVDADNGKWHSNKGPMKVSFCGFTPPTEQLYIQACAEKGIPFVQDMSTDVHHGVTDVQGTLHQGRRHSVVKAFLVPVMNRPNLRISKNSFVEEILIDCNNVARGVRYKYNGTTMRTVYARKEVICSAGAIMSPVLMMHSGIGPVKQLQKYNIPCKANLQVGENLYDHPGTLLLVSFNPTPPLPPTQPLDNIYQWAVHGSGPLTAILQMWAFLSTNTSRPLNRPDTQVTFVYFPTNSSDMLAFLNTLDLRNDIIQNAVAINAHRDIGFIIPVLIQQQSVGYIRLNGASVYDKPYTNLNFFDVNDDLELMVTAIQNQIALLDTKAFQSVGAKLEYPYLSECDPLPRTSRAYWKCYTKYFSSTAYHQVGTCKMGPKSDRGAVVDARLRVYYVSNLRVVDAGM